MMRRPFASLLVFGAYLLATPVVAAPAGIAAESAGPAQRASLPAWPAAPISRALSASPIVPAAAERALAPSIHEDELRRHRDHALEPRRLPPRQHLLDGRAKTVERIVYGYYPFWVQDLTTIRWEALTHLAWFSVEMNAQGGIDALHGWPDAETVAAAHDAGVRVDLTFTLFDGGGIKALVNDPARRAKAIDNMLDLVEEGGADGVAIDFEGFIDGTKDGFVTFVAELRAEMDARGLVDHEISMAGPAVDWSDEWDVAALLDYADSFFIMGYGFFWNGSAYAGPTGILRTTPDWTHATSWSALRSVARWATSVGPEKRRKIVYGVPYYGHEWTTASAAMGAAAIDSIQSITYAKAKKAIEGGLERLWDEGSKTPWYTWQAGGAVHQVYYDDAESLDHKLELAVNQGLGGIGMWALNYDAPHGELWDVVEARMGPQPEPPEGHRLRPIAIASLPFSDERDTSEGPSQYFNFYACDSAIPEYGREWVYRIDVCQPGTIAASIVEHEGADPDVHLLSDLREDACLARAHQSLSAHVEPGRYYVVVDTFVSKGVELEGPYSLDVTFEADPATAGCAAHLACVEGACACPEKGHVDCDGACVDVASDPANCGACGAACPEGETCMKGACSGVPASGASGASASAGVGAGSGQAGVGGGGQPGRGDDLGASDTGAEEGGCACEAAPRAGGAPTAIALSGLALLVATRRRRGASPRARRASESARPGGGCP